MIYDTLMPENNDSLYMNAFKRRLFSIRHDC